MNSLRFVRRNEQKYYCFIEICKAIFPNTPKSTVRGWLKALQINTVVCSAEERTFFRQENPFLCGTFGLVCHDDLLRLIDARGSSSDSKKTPSKRAKLDSRDTTSTSSSSTYIPEHQNSDEDEPMACNNDQLPDAQACIVSYSNSESSDEEGGGMGKKNFLALQDSQESPQKLDFPANSLPSENQKTVAKRRSSNVLSLEDAPVTLKTEVKSLREFYMKSLNHLRRSAPQSQVTTDKMIERLLGFMHFCRYEKNMSNLSLTLFNDSSLFTCYVEYLRDVRKLQPSTISNFLTVAINIVKYNTAMHDSTADPENAPAIHAYRGFQRQFMRESYQLAKRAKEGLSTKKSTQQFYFAHVLETLRRLREKYLESKGIEKARYLHDFVLLALYLRAMPGRSKEIRTLQLYLEDEKNEPFDFCHFESGNFIVFQLGQRIVLIQSDFKTYKSTGATKLDISDDTDLVYYLQLYAKARPALMLGKNHDYFFLDHYGQPFSSSSAIAKYLSDIFDREVSVRASTTALRHALITYFNTIDESKDVNVRQSLASLMKHSVRLQTSVYSDLTHEQKTQAGRNLLRNKLAADVFGQRDEVENLVHDSDSDTNDNKDSSDEMELRPEVNDIVALLDGQSTAEDISFFLAKVARYTQDRSEAHLMHLELVEGSDNLYTLKPGKVWKEPTNALVFPVDVVYNASKKAYELRTSAEDIYKCVHGRK